MENTHSKLKIFKFLITVFVFYFSFFNYGHAALIDELKQKIKERNTQIDQIQREIEQYQKEIDSNAKEAASLKNQIKILETTKKKLSADINLTQKQINATELNIDRLNAEINLKNKDIGNKMEALAEIVRSINEAESTTMVELALSNDVFSDYFGNIEKMNDLQKEVKKNLDNIRDLKKTLEGEKKEKEFHKNNLIKLKVKYVDQKQIADINQNNKDKLLTDTKNREAVYKKLLADRVAKQKAFEKEISQLEEELRTAVDPTSLPRAGSGVLKWPLDKIKVTQRFGHTEFALAHGGLYGGGVGHNGVDFAAPIGTQIKSAKDGVVVGVGNTDAACAGVSYGKWVLVKHSNNLSTLYAHLSLIKVSPGDSVETGQILGYSGDTGYATGPHLHLGVLASEGVEVKSYKSKICGTTMVMPMAVKKNTYLNPLDYL